MLSFEKRQKKLDKKYQVLLKELMSTRDVSNMEVIDYFHKKTAMVNKDFENLKSEIETATSEQNQDFVSIISNVTQIERTIKTLDKESDRLQGQNSGSIQMYEDIRLLYNQSLISNWLLVISLLYGASVFYYS